MNGYTIYYDFILCSTSDYILCPIAFFFFCLEIADYSRGILFNYLTAVVYS